MPSLKERVAIVTGGGGGIGWAISLCFAREGARLLVADIVSEVAERVAAEIKQRGGEACTFAVDVTKKESVKSMIQLALDLWGRIDILVNNAGGSVPKLVVDMEESHWDKIVDVNLKSVFLCSQAVLPIMIRQGYGRIVSLSSIYGFTGSETRADYAAAKAGVAAFTRSVALEVIRNGILVNAIAPGRVATERLKRRYPEGEWERRSATIPIGRAAEPEEIARTALFLAQEENGYITGQTIHVNGGWLNY